MIAPQSALFAGTVVLVPLLFLTLPTAAVGQSRLPACPNDNPRPSWDKRQGTKSLASGGKFVGEFRGGKLNGQGTHTYTNGAKYVGEFSDGNFSGQGTL